MSSRLQKFEYNAKCTYGNNSFSVSERLCFCMDLNYNNTISRAGSFQLWRHYIRPNTGLDSLTNVLQLFREKPWELIDEQTANAFSKQK